MQPLDVSVNKSDEAFLRQQFQEWYAQEICRQMNGEEIGPVDLKLSVMKPLGVQWMIKLFDYLKLNLDIIQNGFKGVGITDFLVKEL